VYIIQIGNGSLSLVLYLFYRQDIWKSQKYR
jgi:hypothetical protein